jgi:hypothetical protein
MEVAAEELRAKVFGLAVACPLDTRCIGAASQLCPLECIRQLSLRERAVWANALSIEDLARLVTEHDECLKKLEETPYPSAAPPR